MRLPDHKSIYRLWVATEGMCLTEDDNRAGIALYLRRNRGLCFVAFDGEKLIGTVLCGHDGRRGILRHLAVESNHRKRGIARRLVRKCLIALNAQGIKKCNIFVMNDNVRGIAFWRHLGFKRLEDDFQTWQLGTSRG